MSAKHLILCVWPWEKSISYNCNQQLVLRYFVAPSRYFKFKVQFFTFRISMLEKIVQQNLQHRRQCSTNYLLHFYRWTQRDVSSCTVWTVSLEYSRRGTNASSTLDCASAKHPHNIIPCRSETGVWQTISARKREKMESTEFAWPQGKELSSFLHRVALLVAFSWRVTATENGYVSAMHLLPGCYHVTACGRARWPEEQSTLYKGEST